MRVEVFCEITFVVVCNRIFVIDGLGWVEEMMGWVGMGYENWTHDHVRVVRIIEMQISFISVLLTTGTNFQTVLC